MLTPTQAYAQTHSRYSSSYSSPCWHPNTHTDTVTVINQLHMCIHLIAPPECWWTKNSKRLCRGRATQTAWVGCFCNERSLKMKASPARMFAVYNHLTRTWDDSEGGKCFSLAMGMHGGGSREMGGTPTWASCLRGWARETQDPLVTFQERKEIVRDSSYIPNTWTAGHLHWEYFEQRWC